MFNTEGVSSNQSQKPAGSRDKTHGFGAALKAIREKKGLPRAYIAGAVLSSNGGRLGGIEEGRYGMSIDTLFRWCEILGVEMHVTFKDKVSADD
jgi:transcriptional regulator with XRE-family HTH domain